ncbi:hypothetical protein [Deinococcus petrolearius]|uniref:Uncharacterized protein n=1 Tax=Deinococcus petrolearius TaxID=1751295 RepID=A0ABW1DN99_9DEIO
MTDAETVFLTHLERTTLPILLILCDDHDFAPVSGASLIANRAADGEKHKT